MPIYEYQCPQCHTVFEEWLTVSASADHATNHAACPQCGTDSPRIISQTAFVLKGSGWYVTEYGNRKESSATTESAKTPPSTTPTTNDTQASDKNTKKSDVPSTSTSTTDSTAPSVLAPKTQAVQNTAT